MLIGVFRIISVGSKLELNSAVKWVSQARFEDPTCFSEDVYICSFQPSTLDSEAEREIKVWLWRSRDKAGG